MQDFLETRLIVVDTLIVMTAQSDQLQMSSSNFSEETNIHYGSFDRCSFGADSVSHTGIPSPSGRTISRA